MLVLHREASAESSLLSLWLSQCFPSTAETQICSFSCLCPFPVAKDMESHSLPISLPLWKSNVIYLKHYAGAIGHVLFFSYSSSWALVPGLAIHTQVPEHSLPCKYMHTCTDTQKRETETERHTQTGEKKGVEGEKDLGSIIWVSESYLTIFILWLPGALVLQYVLQQIGDGEAHSLDIFIWNLPFLKIPRWIVSTRTEM